MKAYLVFLFWGIVFQAPYTAAPNHTGKKKRERETNTSNLMNAIKTGPKKHKSLMQTARNLLTWKALYFYRNLACLNLSLPGIHGARAKSKKKKKKARGKFEIFFPKIGKLNYFWRNLAAWNREIRCILARMKKLLSYNLTRNFNLIWRTDIAWSKVTLSKRPCTLLQCHRIIISSTSSSNNKKKKNKKKQQQ